MENKEGLCEAEVKKNLVLVEIGGPLTIPLATLNRSCGFRKEWNRIQVKWHGLTKEQREKNRERTRTYHQRPEIKVKMRAYRQRPEIKAKRKAYYRLPEVKAKMKVYNQRPEVKARMRAYHQRPENKDRAKRRLKERRLKKLETKNGTS